MKRVVVEEPSAAFFFPSPPLPLPLIILLICVFNCCHGCVCVACPVTNPASFYMGHSTVNQTEPLGFGERAFQIVYYIFNNNANTWWSVYFDLLLANCVLLFTGSLHLLYQQPNGLLPTLSVPWRWISSQTEGLLPWKLLSVSRNFAHLDI